MAQRRKLQVFVSSTYTDLREERQIAVEAILTTGHIPAGMELFAGQNEDQMNIIKQWIDESDIYMLLLGGRYGSVEEISKKSYTHLEYDYARSIGKTIFVVVAKDSYINERVKTAKEPGEVMELKYRAEYDQFKKELTGKFVKFWSSHDNLQLAIINTLNVLDKDESLIGWIPGSEATNLGAIAEELARLAKENSDLRNQLGQSSKESTTYSGLTFDDMYKVLNRDELDFTDIGVDYKSCFNKVAMIFGDEKPSIIHVFWIWINLAEDNVIDPDNSRFLKNILLRVKSTGLIQLNESTRKYSDAHRITPTGIQFLLRLAVERNTIEAEKEVEFLKSVIGEFEFDPDN